MKIGVLSLQGGFKEHANSLFAIGVVAQEVRNWRDLQTCDALIIPGGESTVMHTLMFPEISAWVLDNKPYMGTCAGAILLAYMRPDLLQIRRNAYGAQLSSFVESINFNGMAFKGVFIRAPLITSHSGSVIASMQEQPVAVRYGQQIALTFHPELTASTLVHEYFCEII